MKSHQRQHDICDKANATQKKEKGKAETDEIPEKMKERRKPKNRDPEKHKRLIREINTMYS